MVSSRSVNEPLLTIPQTSLHSGPDWQDVRVGGHAVRRRQQPRPGARRVSSRHARGALQVLRTTVLLLYRRVSFC